MRIQRPAQPPQWPRMSAGPIIIQYLRERPSINQRPVTPPRWRVPQCTMVKASTPLISHSLPFQRPIGIQRFLFGLERCEFPGLYKPALPDLRQDLTADPYQVNNSGSGLSSPSLLQPCTKPFSGRPARPQMTCPTREAGGAIRERPGIIYQRRDRNRSGRSCCSRTPSPAAHCCGYWEHQPATTSAINQETRF